MIIPVLLSRDTSDSVTSNPLFGTNIAVQTCLLTLTTFLVSLRYYVRVRLLKVQDFEDVLCTLQLVLFAVYVGLACHWIELGAGYHEVDLSPQRLSTLLYWGNVVQIFYPIVVGSTKVTILYMYMKLFAPSRYTPNWHALVLLLVANVVFYITAMFLKIFQCYPRTKIWSPVEQGTCLSNVKLQTATASWNTISDLAIVALPGLFISQLNFGRKQKLRTIFCFTIAAVSYPIFSVVGILYRQLHANDPDATYWQPRILLFTEAEVAAGIVCSCIPAIQRLIRPFLMRLVAPQARAHEGPQYPLNHTYTNIERGRQRRRTPITSRLFDSEFWEGTRQSRNEPTVIRSHNSGEIAANRGILMTTDITVVHETAMRKASGDSTEEKLDDSISRPTYPSPISKFDHGR